MEFLSTICLSYIHWAHSSCYTNLAYSKEYVFALRSTYIIWYYCSRTFYDVLCDCDMWIVTVMCDIMLTPNPKSKNKKINRNENENNSSPSSLTLTLS